MLRYVLLALLADGRPGHGYALMKAYAERSGVRLSMGNFYRELQRLVSEGLIAQATNPEGADPRRAPYAITAPGLAALAGWLAAPARSLARGGPDHLSYRIAVLGDMDPEQASAFLDDLHAELWAQTKAVERERSLASRLSGPGDRVPPTRAALLARRVRYLAADLELVDEMRGIVNAWRAEAVSKPLRVATVQASQRRRGKSRGSGDAMPES